MQSQAILSNGKQRLFTIPVKINSEHKRNYTRLAEGAPLLATPGIHGPIYTIWGAQKPVMLQFKRGNIAPENMPGIALVEGDKAQITFPANFLPHFAFRWLLGPSMMVVVLPTRSNQCARYFPPTYEELMNNFTVVVYNLSEGKNHPPQSSNDNISEIIALKFAA